ncbi:endolytic transglycosylase MltG [Streptomyces sp. NRRL S-340]|uniref:endolytic transglycosylase MltG n=1 Tax=Streptomyces sp. NRRL S-340 TaxID=1463901 RepID=UPI000D1B8523|nr:endolytic transglycosylase MltG [Streptomyces sp. NRRL S-340]
MTEYGRGPGSEPWHPEDPLYGDGGWGGQQAPADPQSSYGGLQHHPQPQQYQQHPQHQQQYGGWSQEPQPGHDGPYQQHYGEQGSGQPPHYGEQGGHPYGNQQRGGPEEQYGQAAWDGTGAHAQPSYGGDPADPYGGQSMAYGPDQPDLYGTPEAYPPPQPPNRRGSEPEPRPDWDPEPGPAQEDDSFFAGGDDADGDPDADAPVTGRGRGDRKGRGGKGRTGKAGRKRRNGCACLVVVMVFGGGVAGVGYYGYHFYQDRFGAAPDYAGSGNGEQVTVVIPKDAGGYVIGQVLKKAGVVESVDAFVSAQTANPDGKQIQDGVYTLQKHMSAASAVQLMLSPKSRSNLIIAEGSRNTAVYTLIDKRLGVPEGTTASVAKKDYKKLGLPEWALNHPDLKDPLEGFLYPSSYAVAKGQKPEDVLKGMVARATETYAQLGLAKKARSLGLDGPWQLLTVASLAQAEGTSHDDFRKMAEVVYNRLKPGNAQTNGKLEFDSTYNYVKNQSKIDLSIAELRRYANPYNTYYATGLPPGPIDNPGEEALKGALDPTDDGWYYFISMDGRTSKFTKTLAEHEKLVDEWNLSKKKQ